MRFTTKIARKAGDHINGKIGCPLTVGPVAFNLLSPVSVSLPGIEGRVYTAAPFSWSGCRRNPFTILLPAIRILWLFICNVVVSGLFVVRRRRLYRRFVIVGAGPTYLFAILHLSVLAASFQQMLHSVRAGAQELHHSADRHFAYTEQQLMLDLYLIRGAEAALTACGLTKYKPVYRRQLADSTTV